MPVSPYIGRFAPSPSGPLHFGSLVAALGSYLQARTQGGRWLLRIEDIDPPREVSGAADLIQRQLEAFGLQWDNNVLFQHTRHHAYDQALRYLQQHDHLFACSCSRAALAKKNYYDGHCVSLNYALKHGFAWRVKAANRDLSFDDGVFGHCRFLDAERDAFIVHRRDGLYAYQLAVVVDDIEQGISEIVRGADLLDATPRQRYLWQLLGRTPPRFVHLPLVKTANGLKLSKQNHAPALTLNACSAQLCMALTALNHPPPAELIGAAPATLLAWAITQWQLSRVPTALPALPD